MYKVVVVDDEQLLVRGIKKAIELAHPGFAVVAEITDSELAINEIERLQPDLVFVDIKMPMIDGLMLIEELLSRGVETKFVILSGFNQFEYAKKAITFDVEDYLLKPVSPLELKQFLNRIHFKLESTSYETQLAFLNKLSKSGTRNFMKTPNSFHFTSYQLLTICFNSYGASAVTDTLLNQSDDKLIDVLQSVLNIELLGIQYWKLDTSVENKKNVVMGLPSNTIAIDEKIAQSLHLRLCEHSVQVTIVVGKTIPTLMEIPDEIQSNDMLLMKHTVFGHSSLVFADHERLNNTEFVNYLDSTNEKLLTMFAQNSNLSELKIRLHQILLAHQADSVPRYIVENTLKHVIAIIKSVHSFPYERLFDLEKEIDILMNCSTNYDQLYDGFTSILDDCSDLLVKWKDDRLDHKKIVDKVEEYIWHNYSYKISLEQIAKNFGIVLPYLSSIFKEHKGISPIKFIIQLRINKAKELLMITPPIPLKDIAQTIGYDDPFYFSKLFKSETGQSPSDYKKNTP